MYLFLFILSFLTAKRLDSNCKIDKYKMLHTCACEYALLYTPLYFPALPPACSPNSFDCIYHIFAHDIRWQVNYFFQLLAETGPILLVLGISGAMLQISIFVTISK